MSTPAATSARVWADGQAVDTIEVAGRATIALALEGERWHAVVLEVPELLEGKPPRGLRLERLSVAD